MEKPLGMLPYERKMGDSACKSIQAEKQMT